MSTMTQPLSYEIITPGGYVIDKITHKVRCEQWTAIVNECLASGMPKTTWLAFCISALEGMNAWSGSNTRSFAWKLRIVFPSGRSPPLVRADALFIIKVDFPSPESPCNKVSFPYGIYGYHALTFLKNWMRTAKEKWYRKSPEFKFSELFSCL